MRRLFDALAVQHETPGSPAGGPPPAPPPPAAPPAPPPAAVPPAPAATPPAEPPRDFEKEIADLRRENASWRTKFQGASKTGQDAVRALAAQLGLEIPGGEPDANVLKGEVEKLKRQNVEFQIGTAVEQASRKHGADSDLLIPFLRGSSALDKLDPAAENFQKEVSDLVKGLLEKNPKLKAVQVATRSGSPFPAGQQTVQQITREQLKTMSSEEIDNARKAGALDQILGRI